MSDKNVQINPHFFQLVVSLQSAASFQMGKTVSPISGKIEKDLVQAKTSIDMLVMIQEKTKGNLSDEEKRIIDSTVYNLQMNYIDETKKDADTQDSKNTQQETGNDSDRTDDKTEPESGEPTEKDE